MWLFKILDLQNYINVFTQKNYLKRGHCGNKLEEKGKK